MIRILSRLTPSTFRLPSGVTTAQSREVETAAANNIPALHWPNGRWCFHGNLFMLHLWKKGHSRRGRGGTLGAYAANISALLRHCHFNGIDVHELTDSILLEFINKLRAETRFIGGPRVRDDTSVRAIVSTCLDFIEYLADFRQDPHLIGKEGRISAYKVESLQLRRHPENQRNSFALSSRWHHQGMPTRTAVRRRLPISKDNIRKLREQVLPCSSSLHQRVRRYTMLTALEVTGGRRIEVSLLRVSDVIAAVQSKTRELRLFTAKRRGGQEAYRHIPVATVDLAILVEYIRFQRKATIRKTIGISNDHGYVFVNEKTGKPLMPNTVTQEVHLLAKSARIVEVTCPHMFRHRYITKIFIQLIEQENIENAGELRRALLSTMHLKQKLMQWTGHTRIESLDRYIDLAFAEFSAINNSVARVLATREIQAVEQSLNDLASDMEAGEISLTPERLRALASALKEASTSGSATKNSPTPL